MKLKTLVGMMILCCLWSIPVMAQYTQDPDDQANADTISIMVNQPEAGANDSLVTAELYFYNDVQSLSSMSAAFTWDNPNLVLDSAALSTTATNAFDFIKITLYKNNLDSSNAYRRFQAVLGRLFGPGLDAGPTSRLMIRYYFHLTDWSVTDSFKLQLSDFNAFSFVDRNSNVEYSPLWGGDLTVYDVNRPEPTVLEVVPDTLDFSGVAGGANPAAQSFDVTEAGGGAIDYVAIPVTSWITVSNETGTTPATVGVQLDITGLTAGDHMESIQVYSSAAGMTAWVVVRLHLEPGNQAPVLDPIGNRMVNETDLLDFVIHGSDPDGAVAESWLTWSTLPAGAGIVYNGNGDWQFTWTPTYDQAGSYPITFTLSDGELADEESISITVNNTNRAPVLAALSDQQVMEGANLNFGVSATDPDMDALTLTADPWPGTATFTDAGDGSGTFDWTPGNTDAGFYDIWFVVSDGDMVDSGMVTIEVIDADGFIIDPTPLLFTVDFGAPNPDPQAFSISVSDGSLIPFNATESASWFSIDPTSGSTPAAVTVTVDVTGLMGGSYRDSIMIFEATPTKGAEALDPVWAQVELQINYNAVVAPDTLAFEVYQNSSVSPDAMYFTVEELGGAVVDFVTAAPSEPWVVVTDTLGTTPDTVWVTVSTFDLAPGDYSAVIPVDVYDVVNPTHEVVVTLTVLPCASLQPAQVLMSTTIFAGETAMLNQSVEITSSGATELTFEAAASDYFTFTPNAGTTPTTVEVAYNRTFETEGVYADTTLIVATIDPQIADCPSQIEVIAQVTVNRPPSADTVIVVSTPAVPGMRVGVPVIFTNTCALSNVSLVLGWQDEEIHFDSVSFAGTVVEYLDNKGFYETVWNGYQQVTIFANADAQQIVPIGSEQAFGTMWFSLGCDIADGAYPFVIGEDSASPSIQFVRDCGEGPEVETPEYIAGSIIVGSASNYVCGWVVDPLDNEIEGATVELWDDYPFTEPLMSTMSSGIGSFAFDEIMVIPFDLYAYKEGYYPGKVEDINFGDKGVKIVLQPLPEILTATSEWVDYYCPEGSNTFLGASVPVGAVVEAYNQDNLLVGQKMVEIVGQYGFMPVYRASEQFGDDGAITGDVIRFTINGMDAIASGNTTYPGEYAQVEVCLEVRGTTEKSCDLFEGWNLISWNVNTDSDNILTVLDPIMEYVDVVLGFEQGALTFDPDLQMFSTLWDVDHYSGYWVRIEGISQVTLTVTGLPQDPATTTIPITPGWNLVSYIPDEPMSVEAALAYAGDIFSVVYGFPNFAIEVWQPGGQFNQLVNFGPCNGYWLKATDYGLLRYTGEEPLTSSERPTMAGTALSASNAFATTSWVNLYSQQLKVDGETVRSGAVVTAYSVNGDNMVGSYTMSADGQFGFMPVYANADGEATGLQAGDKFYLKVNNVTTRETFTWSGNGDRIEVTELSAAGSVGEVLPQGYSLAQNYPNPFNPSTSIVFSLPQAGQVKIEVFNVLGRSIATIFNGQAEAGDNTVVWDGHDASGNMTASGVYFYRMTTDSYTETRKMMLLK